MKKVTILLVLCASIFGLAGNAQPSKKALKIGGHVPEVVTQHTLNYPSTQLRLSDFRGKLVILDFWSVHCSACIKEMPEMEAYQKKFKDEIQVLLVTTDTKAEIEELKKNSSFFAKIKLPIVYLDKQLTQLFPWTSYGLHVWIDKNGIVRYRTSSGSYTETDITSFLKGNQLSLASRNDTTKFDRYVPLWQEGNGRQMKHVKYYSYITDVLPDFAGSQTELIFDSVTNKPVGVKFINTAISDLYVMAYQEWGTQTFDSIVYEMKDSATYLAADHGDTYKWTLQHAVSYELHVPLAKATELFSFMRQDLERYFDLKGKVDTIQQAYYVLSLDTLLYKQFLKQLKTYNGSPLNYKLTSLQQILDTLKEFKNVNVIAETSNILPNYIRCPVFSTSKDFFQCLINEGFSLTKQFHTIKLLTLKEVIE